jgi:hypothetical protein
VERTELPLNRFRKGAFKNPDLDCFCPLIVRLVSDEGRLGTRHAREVARTNSGSEQGFRSKCFGLHVQSSNRGYADGRMRESTAGEETRPTRPRATAPPSPALHSGALALRS